MRLFLIFFLCLSCWLFSCDMSPQDIAAKIIGVKEAIIAQESQNGLKESDLLFLTVWNFDETILNGDSTEGKKDIYGNVIFKGLAQASIEAGLSKKYSSFKKFWTDYTAMEQVSEPKAWAYAAQILAGAEEKQVLQFTTDYFKNTLSKYFFQASLDLVQALQKEHISIQIITASPRIFVQGAGPLLNIPISDIYGMETTVQNGVLTDRMVLPLTTGEGKVKKIERIVNNKLNQYKKVYVLAGFGNNNFNDMVFLKWIAAQNLPAGKPLAVVDYHPPVLSLNNFTLLKLQ